MTKVADGQALQALEIVETDRIEGFAHPRETLRLIGQDEALARAARAIRGGRPPQAWLITGPPGIGKATLAYRIARYLLAYGATADGPDDLSVPGEQCRIDTGRVGVASGPAGVEARHQSDDRQADDGVVGGRDPPLAGFFGMTSGAGGWRVAIVDTADDMNDNAANALLKMLEEPPARAMLLLLANCAGASAADHPFALPAAGACVHWTSSAVEAELKTSGARTRCERTRVACAADRRHHRLALQLASGEGGSLAR